MALLKIIENKYYVLPKLRSLFSRKNTPIPSTIPNMPWFPGPSRPLYLGCFLVVCDHPEVYRLNKQGEPNLLLSVTDPHSGHKFFY